MINTTQALRTAVHEVLVEMAIDFKLDGDINALDMDAIFEEAERKIKEEPFLRRSYRREMLYQEYLTGDTEDAHALSTLDTLDDREQAMYHLDMAEMYEGLSVGELKDLIKP